MWNWVTSTDAKEFQMIIFADLCNNILLKIPSFQNEMIQEN